MNRKSVNFILISFFIVGMGIGLRFYLLADKPFHHDESLHGFYSWILNTQGVYRYQPMLHGPFLFYSNALVYQILGDNNWTARLLPALFGTLLVILCLKLKDWIGYWGAIGVALLIAIDPAFVYFSRFIRNDIYIATYGTGILLCILQYQKNRCYSYWYGISGLSALAFCTKENTYFLAFSFISFGILYWLYPLRAISLYFKELLAFWKNHWYHLLIAVFIFWIIYIPFYTVFFRYPGDWNGFATGLKYWYHQHQLQRVGGSWWFYLPLMGLYDFLPLFLGTLGIIQMIIRKNRSPLLWFLVYWFLTSFILYSISGEKVPWLMIHITLPLILLSGWYGGTLIENKHYGLLSISGILLILTLNATWMANFKYPAIDPINEKNHPHAELIAYVQTTFDIPQLLDNVQHRYPGQNASMLITGEAVWPLSWYLRNNSNAYFSQSLTAMSRRYDLVVTDADQWELAKSILGPEYQYNIYHLRAWWPMVDEHPDTGLLSSTYNLFTHVPLNQLVRYFLFRETWSQPGSTPVILWIKTS